MTSFLCMTLGSQGQGHGGNDLGWVGARHLYLNFDDPRLLVLISGYPRFLSSFFMTLMSQGQGHGGNDMEWVGARHMYFNFDYPQHLVLISGYPRFLTSFLCMTLGSQGQGHGRNDLGWVGARHCILILMINDRQFYFWLPLIFDLIFLYDLGISGSRSW